MSAIGCSTGHSTPPRASVTAATSASPSTSGLSAQRLFSGALLVWSFGGFSPTEVRGVAASTHSWLTTVYGGSLALRGSNPAYPEVPVEAIAVNPAAYATVSGSTSLGGMLAGGAVLSRTEAALRGVGAGASLQLVDGSRVRVSGVVDDAAIGGYEVALSDSVGARLGLRHPAYILLRSARSKEAVSVAVRQALNRPVLVRAPGERPFLRAADAVLPQVVVKEQFGEFSLRRTGVGFVPDPAWVRTSIVVRVLPVLGPVRCHRRVVDSLAAAMAELDRAGLAGLVDRADFQRQGGCYNPRPLRGGDGELSRHSWGIAVDLDVAANPLGAPPRMDARLVAVMERHGFTWGGRWLRPDGGHFEWVGDSAIAR